MDFTHGLSHQNLLHLKSEEIFYSCVIFLTECIGQMKNTCHTDLLAVGTFHHEVFKKVTLVNMTTDFIRQEPEYWEAIRVTVVGLIFWNSNFCLKAPMLSLATNTVCCCLWNDMFTSFIFQQKSAKHCSLRSPVSAVLGYKKQCSVRNAPSSARNSNTRFPARGHGTAGLDSFLRRTSCFT